MAASKTSLIDDLRDVCIFRVITVWSKPIVRA
jgi:hypothetical protein